MLIGLIVGGELGLNVPGLGEAERFVRVPRCRAGNHEPWFGRWIGPIRRLSSFLGS